jgi:hypothetical protein
MEIRDPDVLAWVWGQRKLSQQLGAHGLLDLICSDLARFENYEWFISLIFFFGLHIAETTDTESVDMRA